jgi:transcriptional regulator with XRE-family HTH domain
MFITEYNYTPILGSCQLKHAFWYAIVRMKGAIMLLVNTFSEWLNAELAKRDWSAADLARQAGVTRGTISNILNDTRNPGPDACVGIARALEMDPVAVFRLAGLLPPGREQKQQADPVYDQACRIFSALPQPERIMALRFLRGLLVTVDDSQGTDEAEQVATLSTIDRMALRLAQGIRDLPEEDAQRLIDLMERFRTEGASSKGASQSRGKAADQPAT